MIKKWASLSESGRSLERGRGARDRAQSALLDDGRLHPTRSERRSSSASLDSTSACIPSSPGFGLGWLTFDIYNDDRSYTDSLPEYTAAGRESEGGRIRRDAGGDFGRAAPAIPTLTPEPSPTPTPSADTLNSEQVRPEDVKDFQQSPKSDVRSSPRRQARAQTRARAQRPPCF